MSWTTLAVSAVSGASGVNTVMTASAAYFNTWDLIKIPSTGEIGLVCAVTSTAITVVRCYYASYSAASAAAAADVVIIGSAFAEGSTSTALCSMSTKVSSVSNYLQIFRKSVEITKSMANTELYGGADRPYQRKKKGIELMRDLERAFLYGQPLEDTSTSRGDSTLVHARRTSGGIDYFISTNETTSVGAMTESTFEGFLRTVFRYGSNTRYLFCAPLILSVISLWARKSLGLLRRKLKVIKGTISVNS